MKRLPIFVMLIVSVIKGVSQESEEEYQNEEEVQSEEEVQEDENGESNYLDIYGYFKFTNDEYSNALDKVNDMYPEDQNVLFTLVVEVQKDIVLKDRLFRELIAKPKKKNPFKGKDSPGFVCILRGLIENKTIYNEAIKDGSSEGHARNAAALAERAARRKCGIAKKVNKL
ncbi:hypothetical protein [Aquimarina algiphila]|uniref:Uncharacterized protein n=1 Tax=Aquimarina algiphila TaxID=2047982 RepID=A0A554VJA9_9FLAO|nr:hypothetical protein [Aquimarina algiphila]TSE07998.1 hypothetical protein FOF46_13945 [Aquimarina algiphila]